MKLFLEQWFNSATFVGEITTASILVFLLFAVKKSFGLKNMKGLTILGGGFIMAVTIGQGVANMMQANAPVFVVVPSIILTSFLFQTFHLIWTVLGAQAIGSLIGYLVYKLYVHYCNDIIPHYKDRENVTLTHAQFGVKESIAQILFGLVNMFVAWGTFNNGVTNTNISPWFTTFILVISITVILIIFINDNSFMISPFMNAMVMIDKIIVEKKPSTSLVQEIKQFPFQVIIQTSIMVLIGVISWQIKWW